MVISMYVFNQLLHHEQDVIQGQFLSRIQLEKRYEFIPFQKALDLWNSHRETPVKNISKEK